MIDKTRVSKILFVTLTNIGDCVMTLPVIAVLRAEFPNARIDVISGKAPLGLFQGSPDLGKVFAYDKKWSLLRQWRWIREIAKERYDLAVDLRHTLIPLLVGVRYRTKMIRIKKPAALSVREKYLSLLRDLGLNTAKRNPIPLFGPEETDRVNRKLIQHGFGNGGDYAVIAPGANSFTKRWTPEGFESVIRYLTQGIGFNVILVGGPGENWSSLSGSRVCDLTGQTTLRELAILIAGAKLVVANDSATLHLAIELRVRTVAVFGPSNHLKYAGENGRLKVARLSLECSPCEAAQCRLERRKCLDDLPSERVKESIGEVLDAI